MKKLNSETIRKKIKAFDGLTEEERAELLKYLDKRECCIDQKDSDSE